MTNSYNSISRSLTNVVAGATTVLAATLMLSSSVAAQSANTDARWQPYLGCWLPNQTSTAVGADAVSGSMVCVVPVAGSASVDLATIVNRRVTSRERVTVNGQRESKNADDCPGWETANWSADGKRIYIRSEYSCSNNLTVKGNGVFAMTEGGDFVQVLSSTIGTNAGARVVKFRQADVELAPGTMISDSSLVTTVASQMPFSLRAARGAAGFTTNANLIVDITKNTNEQIAQAWLGEFGGAMTLNAQELIALSDAGLPGSVTDMMVALSNPTRFQITARGPENAPQTANNGNNNAMDPRCSFDYFDLGWSSMSRYCMARYGMGWGFGYGSMYRYGMGPWGFNQFGMGNFFGNGYYYGNNPIIIVPRDPGNGGSGGRVAGRAVKGGGYTTSGSSGSSGSSGAPRTSSGSSSGGSASSGGGGAAASSGGGGGGGGDAGGRTAKPRPPM
jgi:hypothetical protein